MKVLAIDTASSWCAAAAYDADSNMLLAEKAENIGKGHAEVLMDFVAAVLHDANVSIKDIGRVAVNIGPGSFTGVRIAVSAARGFALALDCPAIGVTVFEALAYETKLSFPERPILILLDAHRGEIYGQHFDAKGDAISEPMILSLDEAVKLAAAQSDDTVLAGTAAISVNEANGGRFEIGVAQPTGKIGTYALLATTREPDAAPKPLYMRGADAKPQIGFALARR